MSSNVNVLAAHANIDGAKFLFHNFEHDRVQQLHERVFDMVQQATGLATSELNKRIKFKCVRGSTSPHGSLWSLFLTGDAARAVVQLPWEHAHHLTELHVKAYLVENEPGAYEWLQDAMWVRDAGVNITFFRSKVRDKHVKGTGEKGVRIGSRKSDKHSVIYRRPNEKPGFETRVSDKTLRRLVNEVFDVAYDAADSQALTDRHLWELLRGKVGRVGFSHAMKVLREMGINITDYIWGVTDDSRFGQTAHAMQLSANEEVSYLTVTK